MLVIDCFSFVTAKDKFVIANFKNKVILYFRGCHLPGELTVF